MRVSAKLAGRVTSSPHAVASSATLRLVQNPLMNCRCANISEYQRSEYPSGGSDRISFLKNESQSTSAMGRTMNTKAPATAAWNEMRPNRSESRVPGTMARVLQRCNWFL